MNAPATAIDFDRQTVEISDQRLGKLRIFNLVMGLLHLISGSLMVLLGNDFELDISTRRLARSRDTQRRVDRERLDQWRTEHSRRGPFSSRMPRCGP